MTPPTPPIPPPPPPPPPAPRSRRVLLAVSTSRYGRHLVDRTLAVVERFRAAGDSVAIDVLYVIETAQLQKVSSRVAEDGFLGLRTQRNVAEALGAEHHRMALRRIEAVRAAAAEHEVPVEVVEVEGSFVEEVLARAEKIHYDTIFITRADRPFISRVLFGSEVDRVVRLVKQEGLGKVVIDDADD